MKTLITLSISLLLTVGSSYGQSGLKDARYEDLPKGVYTALVSSGFFEGYELYFQMSPFFQRGDFNGDGHFDIAIQVVSKTTRKRGIVFLHDGESEYHVIGAGKPFGELGDDFSWLKQWRVDPHSLQQYRISGMAEGLILDTPEFPKGLVYYDGQNYKVTGMDAYSYYSDEPVYSQLMPAL